MAKVISGGVSLDLTQFEAQCLYALLTATETDADNKVSTALDEIWRALTLVGGISSLSDDIIESIEGGKVLDHYNG